jgi:hypothetical protein
VAQTQLLVSPSQSVSSAVGVLYPYPFRITPRCRNRQQHSTETPPPQQRDLPPPFPHFLPKSPALNSQRSTPNPQQQQDPRSAQQHPLRSEQHHPPLLEHQHPSVSLQQHPPVSLQQYPPWELQQQPGVFSSLARRAGSISQCFLGLLLMLVVMRLGGWYCCWSGRFWCRGTVS